MPLSNASRAETWLAANIVATVIISRIARCRGSSVGLEIEDIGTKRLTIGYIRNRMPTFYIEG
ncbi:hypothetical protein HMEPL2_34990 [Vreelandella aquamarina]|uniref:Uncharacterized protein n=1 Tax=Vreelandella aquamarina TaxID=77097 RepID=A0A6F8XG66_9GAMM|nr:hypothetical protein HMSLTHF_08950 [Halomonas meridiana]BCB73148.1 hypothetical protein HMEPL2_34990 [Halomonas meridiana]